MTNTTLKRAGVRTWMLAAGAAIGVAFVLAGCDKSAEREAQARSEAEWARQNAPKMAALNVKGVDEANSAKISIDDAGRVCRAAIASLMGRDPSIIAVTSNDGAHINVSYRTMNDGKVWRNHCSIIGDRVNWAAILDGAQGRWRTEDDIRYVLSGPSIKVTVRTDGELVSEKSYQIE